MKKMLIIIVLIISIAACLFLYKKNQRPIHTWANHILNPSPVTWQNVEVYYQDELICRTSDKGLLFLAWGPEPQGFIGISKPSTESAQSSIANIRNSKKYEILSEHSDTVGGKSAHAIECINIKSQEYTIFQLIMDYNVMIMYAGPKENYAIFQKTINGITFK